MLLDDDGPFVEEMLEEDGGDKGGRTAIDPFVKPVCERDIA